MPGPSPQLLCLTECHRRLLEQLRRRHTSPQRLVRRIEIVLEAAEGYNNEQVAQRLGLHLHTVRLWRNRWPQAARRLEEVEAALRQDAPNDAPNEVRIEAALLKALEEALADAPRPGAPVTFTAEQVAGIVAVSLESPEECGRPISHWTPRELAEEVQKRQMVPSISRWSVGRFLKGERPQAPPQPLLAEPRDRR